eukprot:234169-Rhodomonas_salina.1
MCTRRPQAPSAPSPLGVPDPLSLARLPPPPRHRSLCTRRHHHHPFPPGCKPLSSIIVVEFARCYSESMESEELMEEDQCPRTLQSLTRKLPRHP